MNILFSGLFSSWPFFLPLEHFFLSLVQSWCYLQCPTPVFQSTARRRLSVNGKPKYWMGSTRIGVSRMSTHSIISVTDNPNPTKVDLALFSWRSKKLEKISIMTYRGRATNSEPWMKKVVSSTYYSKGHLRGILLHGTLRGSPLSRALSCKTPECPLPR